MNKYDIGDIVRLRATFTDSGGTAVDPTSVTLQYRRFLNDPSSYSTLVYGVNSIVKAGTGEYYHDFNVSSAGSSDLDGEWRYRWNGTGNNAAAAEGALLFKVRYVG